MQKKVLSEQALYYGDVSMPKGFEIDSLNYLNLFWNLFIIKKNLHFLEVGTCLILI